MKRTVLHAVSILGLTSLASGADDLPKLPAFARYQPMLDHSPFAVATAAAPAPVAPDFAKDLYIANAARAADGDLVTLASNSDKNFKEYLTSKVTNEHGFSISNIEWSDHVGATKVTISKDGQFATLGFNQALLAGPVQNGGPQMPQPAVPPLPMPNQPSQLPMANLPKPNSAVPQLPQLPTPPPRVRPTIPRNPPTPPR